MILAWTLFLFLAWTFFVPCMDTGQPDDVSFVSVLPLVNSLHDPHCVKSACRS